MSFLQPIGTYKISNKYTIDDYYIKSGILKYANDPILQTQKSDENDSASKFREIIVNRDKYCIITGYHSAECDAAHIVPLAKCKSNKITEYDPSNGILLTKSLHKLFDEYMFSINPETKKIIIGQKIRDEGIDKFTIGNYEGKKIEIPQQCIFYLKKHYKKFLRYNNYE